ncbi:hypothetical protein AAHA92_06300 [Salvia divinorum]|uniref:Uncharacterized protein n=1 Tax=Salvia divinorum TaxID=28513 RepID=A0ABD1I580_SALDI
MYPDLRLGYWNNQHLRSSAESTWEIKEFLAPVTTRSGRTVSVPIQPKFEKEDHLQTPTRTQQQWQHYMKRILRSVH